MYLQSGGRKRGLEIDDGRLPDSIESLAYVLSRFMPRIGGLVCLEVKMIRKPSAGKLHAGFDEGGLDGCLLATLNGHEAGNGEYTQGLA